MRGFAEVGLAEEWRTHAGLGRRKLLGGSLAALASLQLSSGCSARDPHTVRFWAMGSEAEAMPAVLKQFALEHPNVQVKLEQLPWLSAHEKLLTAFAGDALPDMAQMGNSWLPEMAAIGALQDLQPWIDQSRKNSSGLQPDDYFPGIWATNVVEERTVGVPWYVDTRLLFVRHDLLAKAGQAVMPVTWEQWRQSLLALQASGVKSPIYLPLDEFAPLLALSLQSGAASAQADGLLREGGRRGNFSGPGFRAALALYTEFFRRGFAPGLSRNTVANVWQEIARGTFAYYISGPWNIGEFKKRLPAELQGSWSTAALPGPNGPGASVAGGASLVMFKPSKVKPAAWKLIEYLSRPSVQQEFYRSTGNLPPRRSSWALPLPTGGTLQEDVYAKAFRDQLERVRPAPMVPEGERIVQEMQLYAARAVHERGPLEPIVTALDERVDGILEKRRWMLDHANGSVGTPLKAPG